jgi:Tfp pilus assembly protein PilO
MEIVKAYSLERAKKVEQDKEVLNMHQENNNLKEALDEMYANIDSLNQFKQQSDELKAKNDDLKGQLEVGADIINDLTEKL